MLRYAIDCMNWRILVWVCGEYITRVTARSKYWMRKKVFAWNLSDAGVDLGFLEYTNSWIMSIFPTWGWNCLS